MSYTFGKDKKPLEELSVADIDYWGKVTRKSIGDPEKSQYKSRNEEQLSALIAQRNKMVAASKKDAERSENALAKASSTAIGKAIGDPVAVTEKLFQDAKDFHLIAPSTHVDMIPAGCGVAISYVTVNNDASKGGPGEVYQVGDKVGLSGTTLLRVASAAGLDWDPVQSGRLDNGSNPHYCHYRAVGLVRNFDGSVRTCTGEVEMDAREGSPQLEEIRKKASARAKKSGKENDNGDSQILELRKFLLRHAESKAKNRAIANMGVKRSWHPQELTKAFAVARLTWTGQTNDPQLRRVFAEKTADAMIGGITAMYGRNSAPAAQAPPTHNLAGHAPPPMHELPDAIGWDDGEELTPAPTFDAEAG